MGVANLLATCLDRNGGYRKIDENQPVDLDRLHIIATSLELFVLQQIEQTAVAVIVRLWLSSQFLYDVTDVNNCSPEENRCTLL